MRGMARGYAAGGSRGPGWREIAGTLGQLQAGRQAGNGMACSGDVDLESAPFIHPTSGYLNTGVPQASPSDIERAVNTLRESKNPVLVAGNGVHMARAHDLMRELAELWGMPVATSYKGKSTIEETHPLAVGMAGVYGQRVANAVVGDADVVLVVGASLSPHDTVRESPEVFDPLRQSIIQIDIDPRNTGGTFPVDLGLVGDAAAILSSYWKHHSPWPMGCENGRKGEPSGFD